MCGRAGGFGPCLRSSLTLDLRFAHGSRLFPRTPSQRCGDSNRGHAATASGLGVSPIRSVVSVRFFYHDGGRFPCGPLAAPSRDFVGCQCGRQFAPGIRAARAPATTIPPLRRPAQVMVDTRAVIFNNSLKGSNIQLIKQDTHNISRISLYISLRGGPILSKELLLEKLLVDFTQCSKCPELCTHIQFPKHCHGNISSSIMLVSEGAYIKSIQEGRYFTRGFLRDALPNLEDYCYLTDVIKCDSCGKKSTLLADR